MDFDQTVSYLAGLRNDLQETACSLVPSINTVLKSLDQSGAAFVRMSGSGATCFGLYANDSLAQVAAEKIKHAQPNWWVKAVTLG